MPRANRSSERRADVLPTLARTFAELGYRRATTSQLAARCGLTEVALYRVFADKRAMFLAAIEHVYDTSMVAWEKLLVAADDRSPAERLLEHESVHHGEFGLYRLVFAGLNETDDPEIREALARMYRRYFEFVVRRIEEHRRGAAGPDAAAAAWALIGMGTMSSIGRELGTMNASERRNLWTRAGATLLGGKRKKA
jgi:AcrR family transcriptional regulator